MINTRNNTSKNYIHLVNIETLDVVRVEPFKKYENENFIPGENDQFVKGETKILKYLNNSYSRTRPEIYRTLTKQSFVKTERPRRSGEYVIANIFN